MRIASATKVSIKRIGTVQKKVLLLLLGGLALGCSYSPNQSFRVIRLVRKEWKNITKQSLENSIEKLYKSHLVDMKLKKDGSLEVILTDNGKKQALRYNLDTFQIKKPFRWDKKWRVVAFDIPEEKRAVRDIFRDWLKRLNFYKLQNSVFIHPYDCRDEFNFLVELHRVRKYTRFIVAEEVDNEIHLRKLFNL